MVGASRRLKELQVHSNPDSMANTLRRLPAAEARQPGPLSQLEDVGTLTFVTMGADIGFDGWREGLGRLQTVLVDRGCRSIKRFKAKFEMEPIDRRIFPTLSAIETFTRTVCVKPDIPVDISILLSEEHLHETEYFDLGLLCDVPTRPEPSPFIQRHIQQMAAASLSAFFTVRPHHLTNPGPLDTPSPAAIALAHSLTFTKVLDVVITEDDDVVYAEEEVQPDPVVLNHLPHNAFPAARRLIVNSREAKVMGRKMVHKMPAVKEIDLSVTDPTEEQAVGMLQALGRGRHLERFDSGCVMGLGEGGVTWGDMADKLPTISVLEMFVEVPEDLGDGDAAGEFGIACVRSLLKIRGIKELRFQPIPNEAFKRLVEERTNGDAIEGLEKRHDISWGGYQENMLILKPLDT
ncbi:unnamed protein product [Vitrella brassicaformis CCMP3155]|uniref:Uncharacterized protein n=2 Tax=Vitrella brassicaformis TaxID=1169539 RepID=A0A0G4EUG6_VITBC|nr:unnamed protein product [Vitrella brassicaformis CCMP3155]|eukprot:CEM01731.1 unnamed protein product [Vitrella brassicaformis CCMP3155]